MNTKTFQTISLLLLAMVLVILWSQGWNEETDRLLIRMTARSSILLFLLAFSASAIYKIWPGTISRQLLSMRRGLGLAFAFSHSIHLCFVLLLQFYFSAQNFEERGVIVVGGGAVAYLFLYAMAFTSTDYWQQKLGWKKWSRLHTIGSYYIFFVFSVSYLPRSFNQLFYSPFAVMLVIAFLLRMYVLVVKKRGTVN